MENPGRRAVIFANGEVKSVPALRRMLQPGDYLAAADGGIRHLLHLGLKPNLLVGDLDSIPPEARGMLEEPDLVTVRHPVEKDETDLELALAWVLEHSFKTIRIAGGAGGRLDHTLGNLLLLTASHLLEVDIRFDDGLEEIAAISKRGEFFGNRGDILSLLALVDSYEVTTEGLYYPLAGETLFRHRARGISNVFTSQHAVVNLDEGLLIAIHTRQNTGYLLEGDTGE